MYRATYTLELLISAEPFKLEAYGESEEMAVRTLRKAIVTVCRNNGITGANALGILESSVPYFETEYLVMGRMYMNGAELLDNTKYQKGDPIPWHNGKYRE